MIHFQDIQFRYEGTISSEIGVKDINLIVHTGECVLICGRSGCGKTTLTKLINGLIPNYFPGELSGNVQIDDENILGAHVLSCNESGIRCFKIPERNFSM